MREHLQVGDLPGSQYGILQFLQEGDWGVCDDLVTQGFVHIVAQLESPAIFDVKTDGLGDL